MALYACPNHTDDDIHSDHGYLETWEIPGGPPFLLQSLYDFLNFFLTLDNHDSTMLFLIFF